MQAPLTILTSMLNGLDGTSLIVVDALIKATLVFSVAGLATLALGRASAALRHLIWALALASVLALPLLSIALPRWQLPVVRVAAQQAADITVAPLAPPSDAPAAIAPPIVRRDRAPETSTVQAPVAPVAAQAEALTPPAAPISWSMMLLVIWAAGATLVLARLLAGLLAVQWMSRRTAQVIDAPWLPLAVELASELGLTRRLRFAESGSATMPMACGVFNPIVMMPADAARWPVERLRIVLLHELAHVKRRDCLTHVVAQLACALYWFNPLVWIAARHVRTERERACDDLVLASGTRGSDYAEELLEIARVMRAGRFPTVLTGATLAMAHRSQLEGRLIAILDPKVPRSGVSRLRAAFGIALVACTLPPLATLQPWTIEPALQAASPSPSASSAEVEPRSQAITPQPEPRPTPQPEPHVAPGQIADAVRDAVGEQARATAEQVGQAVAQAVSQSSEVQAQVQSHVQTQVESNVRAHVEPMIAEFPKVEWGGGAGGQERKAADPRMVAALTAALKDSDKEVRETAMHALVQLRDPSVFEPLVQALKDSSPDVREEAARGLAQMRDKRAVEPLIAVLKDANPDVREAAIQGLSELRDPRAFDAFLAALRDDSPDVREKAAFALGQMRDKRAVAALNTAIKDSNADVREQVVFALGQLRDVSALEGLTAALRDEKPDVREKAAFALGQLHDKRAVEPLITALKDASPDVRQHAAFALGQFRERGPSVDALMAALKDSNADVREKAAFALGQIGDPRAIEPLTNALKDPIADVRRQAAFALGQLAR
jgi:HEAT repeat protein/beta-lactamase regulating signal transducer with metallopeptidase domain